MGAIELAQIGKLQVDINRRTDDPTKSGVSGSTLVSNTDNKVRFSPININQNIIKYDYIIEGLSNATSTGPLTIEDNVTITVEDGSTWVIL